MIRQNGSFTNHHGDWQPFHLRVEHAGVQVWMKLFHIPADVSQCDAESESDVFSRYVQTMAFQNDVHTLEQIVALQQQNTEWEARLAIDIESHKTGRPFDEVNLDHLPDWQREILLKEALLKKDK